MTQIYRIENFLSSSEVEYALQFKEHTEDFVDNDGVYASGTVTTGQQWLDPDSTFSQTLLMRLQEHEPFRNNRYDALQVMHAYHAYDVHSDWYTTRNQTVINDVTQYTPTYTVIAPLTEGDFATVVFEQAGQYNNFSEYKLQHEPVATRIDDATWNQYCSHCHAEDQQYLTLLDICEWRVGDAFAFDRTLFHCSANFTTPKRAIVAWLSRAAAKSL